MSVISFIKWKKNKAKIPFNRPVPKWEYVVESPIISDGLEWYPVVKQPISDDVKLVYVKRRVIRCCKTHDEAVTTAKFFNERENVIKGGW